MTFEASPDSRYSYDRRRFVEIGMAVEPNTVWTFDDMTKQLGRPVEGSDAALQHALRVLARDHGCEFKNIRKVGYLRLCDQGIVSEAGPDRASVSRKVKRAVLRTSNIKNWDGLNDALKREVDSHRSVLSLLRHIVKPSSVKRIKSEVDKAHAELNVDATLKLFRKD